MVTPTGLPPLAPNSLRNVKLRLFDPAKLGEIIEEACNLTGSPFSVRVAPNAAGDLMLTVDTDGGSASGTLDADSSLIYALGLADSLVCRLSGQTRTFRANLLTAHRVNGLNESLAILAADHVGPGGAHHHYYIFIPGQFSKHAKAWEETSIHTIVWEFKGGELEVDVESDHARFCFDGVESYGRVIPITFQWGPIKENNVNGISNEALIAILIDRMEGFQAGEYACHDNQVALDHLQGARLWLHKRTMDRVARNVEGTSTK